MAWIKAHQETRRHPKTEDLADALNVSIAHAVGLLHCFWWWALDYAQDGDLTELSDRKLARAAGWEEDPATFVGAMINAGFINSDRTIHNWDEHMGEKFRRREADAERKRQKKSNDSAENPRGVREESIKSPSVEERRGEEKRREENTTPPTPPSEGGEPAQAPEGGGNEAMFADVMRAWNGALGAMGFPEASKATPKRRRAFAARVAERAERRSADWWECVIKRIAESEFFRQAAKEKRGWLCIDWILNEDNLVKICEGKYDDRPGGAQSQSGQTRVRQGMSMAEYMSMLADDPIFGGGANDEGREYQAGDGAQSGGGYVRPTPADARGAPALCAGNTAIQLGAG